MKTNAMLSPGLLRSGLKRFWPLWLAGFIALFLAIDIPVYTAASNIAHSADSVTYQADALDTMWQVARLGGWFYALVGSIIVALALNEHLFDSRAATFIGSLPIRKTTVYATLLVAGIVVLTCIPVLAAALLVPLRLSLGPVFALSGVVHWCVTAILLAFVFYAIALLCCHLAGTRFVAALLYLVFNLLTGCIEAAISLIVPSLAYGVAPQATMLEQFAPAIWLVQAATGWGVKSASQWPSLLCYALVAAGIMVGSGALFKRRNLEAAGDSVSFAPVRPVLKYLAGVSMALLFGSVYRLLMISETINGLPMQPGEVVALATLMAAGAFIGALFAEMIMSRSTHVLGKVWRSGAALAGLSLVFVAACYFDLVGVARRVPEVSDVEKVMLNCDYGINDLVITSSEGIEDVCDLHRSLITYGGTGDQDMRCYTIGLTYQLKGGRTLYRSYPVLSDYFLHLDDGAGPDEGAPLMDDFARIANSPEGRTVRFARILNAKPADLKIQVEYALEDYSYKTLTLSAEECADLLDGALREDLMEEKAGEVFSDFGPSSGDSYDATLYVLIPHSNYDEQLLHLQLGDHKTRHVMAWLNEHHSDIKLMRWNWE